VNLKTEALASLAYNIQLSGFGMHMPPFALAALMQLSEL
jgi:hypothetical protein